jgi:hypothetical protein
LLKQEDTLTILVEALLGDFIHPDELGYKMIDEDGSEIVIEVYTI